MHYELCIDMSDIAIKVENLSKYYRLGVINNGTLFKDMQTWFARLRGKEDPNGKIGKVYDDSKEGFWALKDLNFEIKKGDRVGIIGHNGAGKSTLLKVLSQITTPTEGNIKINGRIASLLEVGTGFHPEMTGRENIYMNGAILGMKKSEIDKKVDQIIEFSEIGEHIDTPVKRYSSGMYVRLAFAVAAHLDSEILIADEVLAVGDAAFQKKALGKMNELSTGEGRTVLFVSHNMGQVKKLCNKGIVLEKGKVVYEGDLDKAVSMYLLDRTENEYISHIEYEEDKKLNFQLLSVSVLNENKQVASKYETYGNNVIRIKCLSNKKLSDLYGFFSIANKDGDNLVRFDTNETNHILNNLEIGEHEFDICIPNGLLAAGCDYYINANFTSNDNESGFNVFSPGCIAHITIVDSFTSRGNNRKALTSVVPTINFNY